MMDRSDRHFRRLMWGISRRTLLYTEMLTCPAVLHGDREHLLGFHEDEHPLALQLGGDDPEALARCAVIARGSTQWVSSYSRTRGCKPGRKR